MNKTHFLYVGTAGGDNNTILSLWVKQKASSKEDEKKIFEQNKIYLCSTTFEKSTDFIKEYSIPIDCTQPVGIAIDHKDKIWIAATWIGYLVVFDPTLKGFVDFIKIPNWKTNGIFGSMVWGMDFDKNGNLWFTDEVHNAIWRYFTDERKFEIYQAPTKSSYPAQIAFDSQGRVWFSEIFGKKLGVINPSEVVNNTTKGITEFGLDGKSNFATMGPVSISGGNMLWLSAVSFPEGGQIIGFDINTQKFISFDLPKGTAVPIGVVEDSKRRLWINDHAINLFFMFDPSTGKMVKYSTSLPTSRNDTTTLPYWNMAIAIRLPFG